MSIEVAHLIELYKTTLEELRHHDRVHVEVLAGIVIAVSVVVAGTPFVLGQDSPIADTWQPFIKAGIFLFAVVAGLFFAYLSGRLHQGQQACILILQSIEAKLLGQSEQELDGLLIKKELGKSSGETSPKRWLLLKHLPVTYRVLVFSLYIGLVLFLFVAIP